MSSNEGSEFGTVAVDGSRLQVRIEGTGEPMLVVGSAVFYPRVFSRDLREQFRLVFVDLRHFAPLDDPAMVDQLSIETYADDIEHVRQTLALGEVLVLGHSIHGCIALEYARRYPRHLRGVVAMGAYASITGDQPDAAKRLWDAEASNERKEVLARNRAALSRDVRGRRSPTELYVREYAADGPLNWYDAAYDSTWLWEGLMVNGPVIQRLGAMFESYDLAQGPGPIDVPVLIAHGRYDYNAVHTLWEQHRHKLTRHTFALFDRSAHFPSLEEPDRFDQTLVDWVRELALPGEEGR